VSLTVIIPTSMWEVMTASVHKSYSYVDLTVSASLSQLAQLCCEMTPDISGGYLFWIFQL